MIDQKQIIKIEESAKECARFDFYVSRIRNPIPSAICYGLEQKELFSKIYHDIYVQLLNGTYEK